MTINEHAEMTTCNLVEIVTKKWPSEFGNKMTCLCKTTVDGMICAFMYIANYNAWLERGLMIKVLIMHP